MSLIMLTKNNHFFIYYTLLQSDFPIRLLYSPKIEMKIYQFYLLCKKIYFLISIFFIILCENNKFMNIFF